MFDQKKIIDDWNSCSDNYYKNTGFSEFFQLLKTNPYVGFPKAIADILKEYYPDLKGKKVCVPSCGDSTAVYSFCALGAHVTACDISYKQIENGKKIASLMNYNVCYHICDSMEMNLFQNDSFDIVYTSNGVNVWINDLKKMYSNFKRILKKDGMYLFFDTHPFVRPFTSKVYEGIFEVKKTYESTGPFGDVPTFDWRIQDYINSLVQGGLIIQRMEEFHSIPEDFSSCNYLSKEEDTDNSNYNWQNNPWAALPQAVAIASKK